MTFVCLPIYVQIFEEAVFNAPETGLLFEPRQRTSPDEVFGTPPPPAPAGMVGRTSPPGPEERKLVKGEARYV